MRDKKLYPRNAALTAGALVMLFNGLIYAWSIYSGPFVSEFGWNSTSLGLCYTIGMTCQMLGAILGSQLTVKFGMRVSMITGAVSAFLGFLLCSFLQADTFWLLILGYSILAATGAGIIYNTVINAVVRRFPDKKGAASGVLLMGFGASSLLLGSLASIFFALETVGWRMTYALTGALLLVIPLIGAVFISLPKEDQNGSAGTVADGLSAKEMLKTQRFWLLFIINIGLGFFGMGIIGHARYIALEAGIASSLAAFSVGLLAVCNGLGRLLFGFLNDRLGYKPSLLLSIGIMIAGGSAALISLKAGVPGVILVALSFCGVAYGALPTNASACTGEFFGMKNFGLNLSLVNMCVIVSSWGSTISGAVETATGSYTGAILLFLGIELCTFIAALFINGNR